MNAGEKFENRNSKFEELEERISRVIAAADGKGFDELAGDVFRFQREFNPPYDQYCRLLGVGESPAGWREMPALFQAAFKHASLRVFPEEEEIAAFRARGMASITSALCDFMTRRSYAGGICWVCRGCRKSSWSPRHPRRPTRRSRI
jgi:hypothetical protein